MWNILKHITYIIPKAQINPAGQVLPTSFGKITGLRKIEQLAQGDPAIKRGDEI